MYQNYSEEMVKTSNQPQNGNPNQHLETSQRGFHSEIGESDILEEYHKNRITTLKRILSDNLNGPYLLQELDIKLVNQRMSEEWGNFWHMCYNYNSDIESVRLLWEILSEGRPSDSIITFEEDIEFSVMNCRDSVVEDVSRTFRKLNLCFQPSVL